jgi:hypothetical protein
MNVAITSREISSARKLIFFENGGAYNANKFGQVGF